MSTKALSVDQALSRGRSLQKKGEIEEARRLYEAVLERFPNNRRAAEELARLHAVAPSGGGEAQKHQIDKLKALYAEGSHDAALEFGRMLLALHPDDPTLHNVIGAIHSAQGHYYEAAQSYKRAIELKPDYAHAHNNLGTALKELGQKQGAVVSYLLALRHLPDYAEAYNNLGVVLADSEEYEMAIRNYRKAIELKPSYATAYNNLGTALRDFGRHDAAFESYGKALEADPNFASAHDNRGTLNRQLGRKREATADYEAALRIKPDFAGAHLNLSGIKRFKSGDPAIARMEELSAATSVPGEKLLYDFALGKAYDDIGEKEKAFDRYREGNRLRKEELGYRIERDETMFAAIRKMYGSATSTPSSASAEPGTLQPIFILGMPRSGTTLTEQILASHSKVHGAGELPFMGRILTPIVEKAIASGDHSIGAEIPDRIRAAYLSSLTELEPPGTVFTDKMPLNFRFVGFILDAFPEAKIVHLKRDPIAVCWSNFVRYFPAKGLGYANDLTDLGLYYRLYTDLMAFWHARYPGRIYDLQYERLTEHQEEETRKLLAHCGLPWEDQCLAFHEAERAVLTASNDQVRRKIYKGSSEAWRRYEDYLGPLFTALKAS
jgi:tetratricopeptide (TPR) repeat protein